MKKEVSPFQKATPLRLTSGQEVPVYIIREKRNYARASITKKGLIIRIPRFMNRNEAGHHITSFRQWAVRKLEEAPYIYKSSSRDFYTGRVIALRDKAFILDLRFADRKTSSALLKENKIIITLSSSLTLPQMENQIIRLINKCIGEVFYPWLLDRLRYLNARFLPEKHFKQLRLKYLHSVWGSCSHDGNITISTRLLFAPDSVIDYVLVHELVHLFVPNHSQRFWDKVARILPDYAQSEHWLKTHGAKCDF
ncbi:MAG: hypothetical protein KatS3mg031_1451 [Chitinophagales bacterium]|nr:MAG: hypothetical protein KatS3mg031_1451 [Chitinophagales bacterium]